MKRADIRNIFPEATDEQLSQLLSAVHSETDKLKDDLADMTEKYNTAKDNAGKNASDWEKKYNDEHKAFEDFKTEQSNKAKREAKEKAFKAFLEDEDLALSEKGQRMALKYTDLSTIELDEDGKIKGAKDLVKSISEEWADFVTSENTKGKDTKGKDGAGAGGGKKTLTRDEIMNISDTAARQRAIMENPEAFR